MITQILTGLTLVSVCGAPEPVGKRPYEMVWANRVEDDHAPLVDFEDLSGWRVEARDAAATFVRSREQQIWGRHVGRLTYRATGRHPQLRVVPPAPIRIGKPFDAVTCWIYGNNWSYAPDPKTPPLRVSALFEDAAGNELAVFLAQVAWKQWHLCHRRLTPDQIQRVAKGAQFKGLLITHGRNKQDRVVYVDNLAVFAEEFPALTFRPRPKRGIAMFPGQGVGTNTGPGKLPFPTREQTILPDNLTAGSTTAVRKEGDAFGLVYEGTDGRLTYRVVPKTGTLEDVSAQWHGRGGPIRPCVGGGVFLQGAGATPVAPEKAERLSAALVGHTVVSRWRLSAAGVSTTVTYTFRIWGKSLVIDVIAPGGAVREVRYGRVHGLERPRLVTLPYYTYGHAVRPAVVVAGPADKPLFLAGHTDWTRSNASTPWAENAVDKDGVAYNGGVRYTPKTDGKRNDCYERLFLTLSPRFEEVLPNIPNPVSPWKPVTGTRVWRAHGASNREHDTRWWTQCHRYGMTQVVVTDHETGWRDGGESFTFRTRAAPGKGGDPGQFRYARVMQDTLGFVYGPYNNFTDFCPVNEYWGTDLISRRPDRQLQTAWARCYAPKPARAVEYCAKLAPIIQNKFRFSTAYCDVHTATTPWGRTDYDRRVPGAGTFAATFYAYGEIMLLQKQAWNGPVYSEGNNHWLYSGLTDGNYAQDQRYHLAENPWLVDFDLRKMHDLCCNFGMGSPRMFYGRHAGLARERRETDALIDRFLAATVAFGHPGFLVAEAGYHNMLRSYYMLQQLHSRYTLGSAHAIRYVTADGRLVDSTVAVATGAHERSQVVTRYSNGCVTVANGHPRERLRATVYGRPIDLPPNGYAGWTDDGTIEVTSSDPGGHRCDYAATPAYLYVDGQDRFVRFPKAAGRGIGVCRILPGNRYEIIPYKTADCGFAINAVRAQAIDEKRKAISHAELRRSRGLTYVVPVTGAFSYLLEGGTPPATTAPVCTRDRVVPGERVMVQGKQRHDIAIPTDAKPGSRIWRQAEGAWIDFTVVPLADMDMALDGDALRVTLRSNLAQPETATVTAGGTGKSVRLIPGRTSAVSFDLGPVKHESTRLLAVDVRAGAFRQTAEHPMVALAGHAPVAPLPERRRAGTRLRGQPEVWGFGTTQANAATTDRSCGDKVKLALCMHPPWIGGVGYTFVLFDPVTLPTAPPAAFRAVVGKGDGSYLGDGILYKVVVVDRTGTETVAGTQTVTRHQWVPIEADLTRWAGQSVRLKLITDVGVGDNSEGDWGCWADRRIESRDVVIVRRLKRSAEAARTQPGPHRVKGLREADLRRATKGWLRYDGMGLAGRGGQHESYAVLNGVALGPMRAAGGNEARGVWKENVPVPLTRQAIATLGFRNRFELRNPGCDWFKVRRLWIELALPDGRRCSSDISTAVFTQPPNWPYAEGIGVPFTETITVDIWFAR